MSGRGSAKWLTFLDDELLPDAGITLLHSAYRDALVDNRMIEAAHFGLARIGIQAL